GESAAVLRRHRHGAAVICAVEVEALDHAGVTGDEAGTQSRDARTLGERVKDHAALEAVVAARLGRLKQSGRWRALVEIDVRVALVGGDDEVLTLGEIERALEVAERQHRAGGIAGAAEKEYLAALPHGRGHRGEIREVAVLLERVEVAGLGAREQRRALVDLI